MQRAEEGSTDLVRGPDNSRSGLSPVVAFLILLAIVGAIAAAVMFTRPDTKVTAAATTPQTNEPNFALTNEEALTRFNELHDIYRKVSMERDLSLIELLFTTNSPNRSSAVNDIRQLLRDGVIDRSRFQTLSTDVVARTDRSVHVRQNVLVKPRFVDETTGRQLTRSKPTVDEVMWHLKLEHGSWLVHKIELVDSTAHRS